MTGKTRQKIYETLKQLNKEQGFVKVSDVAKKLNLNTTTVRSHLKNLMNEAKVIVDKSNNVTVYSVIDKNVTVSLPTKQAIVDDLEVVDIYSARTLIALRCDGARTKDGVGFSQADVVSVWDKVSELLYKTMYKYRRQLTEMGVKLDEHFEKFVAPKWAKNVKMPFGKYAGKTLFEITEIKMSYIWFMFSKFDEPWSIFAKAIIDNDDKQPALKYEAIEENAIMHKSWDKYVLTFGKHNGKSLYWLFNNDQGYLNYFLRAENEGSDMFDTITLALEGKEYVKEPDYYVDATSRKITVKCSRFNAKTVKRIWDVRWNREDLLWEVEYVLINSVRPALPAENTVYSEAFLELEKSLNFVSDAQETNAELDLLFDYQQEGVSFLNKADGRGLIADEMGLGKTIQSLGYTATNLRLPVLVVCPASVKYNWLEECEKWLNELWQLNLNIVVLNGAKIEDVKADVYIINYDVIDARLDELLSIKAQILILDEAHYIKNYKAARTIAALQLCSTIQRRILLTGTPVLNRPAELYTLLKAINPKLFPNVIEFRKRYCDAELVQYGQGKPFWNDRGASNLEELREQIDEVMICRKKAEVLKDLPPKMRNSHVIKLENFEEYKNIFENFIKYVKETKGKGAAESAEKAEAITKMNELWKFVGSKKVEAAKHLIYEHLEADEPVVVFAYHKEVISALMDEFSDVAVKVDGSVKSQDRQKIVNDFQSGKAKVFIGNIKSAGTGINLFKASNVIFVELIWSPSQHLQAEDRCHRIGQESSVNIKYIVAKNTIDEKMFRMLLGKLETIDVLTDDEKHEQFDALFEEVINENGLVERAEKLQAKIRKAKTEDDINMDVLKELVKEYASIVKDAYEPTS